MKERPILFKGPLVRAILSGQKTVTRRTVNPQPRLTDGSGFAWKGHLFGCGSDDRETARNFSKHCCPHGKPGDRLWVRETWARVGNCDPGYLTFAATYPACLPPELENIPAASEIRWKPSIHMFRRDSRILLEITDVRVERLQDLDEDQAQAEGIGDHEFGCHMPCEPDGYPACSCGSLSYVDSFQRLWESINGPQAWAANPWVWVVEFKRVDP